MSDWTIERAREIVRTQERQIGQSRRANTQTVAQEYKYVFAKGMIQGYELAERKYQALVEALKPFARALF